MPFEGPLPERVKQRRIATNTAVCIATSANAQGEPDACKVFPPFTLLTATDGTPGKNGWVVSPLTVTLAPMDASGTGAFTITAAPILAREGGLWMRGILLGGTF